MPYIKGIFLFHACYKSLSTVHYKHACIRVHQYNQPVAYLGFHFGGGSKFFWKSGGICMARSAMQRVAKPRVC